jgi:tetratricopeptide (TPR) repeat protein
MAFSGNLQGISLADVFQNIAANRVTGSLQVRWRETERYVRFEDGKVSGFSLGVGKGLPLIDHIRQRAYLDEKALNTLTKKRKRSRKGTSTLIVDLGLLTQDEVEGIFAEAVEENIHDLLALKEALFSFTEGDAPPRVFDLDQRNMSVRLEPGPLLLEGARRRDEWERIQRVISSDRDLFVVREGWEQAGLDEVGEHVAQLLDGRTDLAAVLKQLSASRFEILKVVSDLVLQGHARRATGDEIQHLIQDALAEGEPERAVSLLNEALTLERSNTDLREQLAELHAQLDRPQEAAAEYAALGYQASRDDRLEDALGHYSTAARLNPGDLPLHEHWVELLVRAKDGEGLATAVHGLVKLLLDMGLADRARGALHKALDSKLLPDEVSAREDLAQVESSRGNSHEAGEEYLHLANLVKRDAGRALDYLRKALAERPHDQALAARVGDIESGTLYRRRIRRRRLIGIGIAFAVLLAVGLVGLMEITAAHRVELALANGLGTPGSPDALRALHDLQQVRKGFPWTTSGRRAGEHVARLVGLHLEIVEELLSQGEHDRAADLLGELQGIVQRQDYRQRFKALIERVGLERIAARMLARAELLGEEDPQAIAAIEGELADGNLLDFYLEQLPRLQCARARQAVLTALLKMDQPRTLALVAKMYLRERDPASRDLIRELLNGAEAHRRKGRQGEWKAVYSELQRAELNPETRVQAELALSLLRGSVGGKD